MGKTMITVTLTGDKDELLKKLADISSKSKEAVKQATFESGKIFLRDLKANIRGGSKVARPNPSTLKKRQIGKLAGVTPAIPRYKGTKPLIRSGTLLKSIEMRKISGKRYIIGVKPGTLGPQMQNMELVAEGMEYGIARINVKLTRRMKFYLDLLSGKKPEGSPGQRGIAGSPSGQRRVVGSNKADPNYVISTFVVKIPARPVWKITFHGSLQPAVEVFVGTYLRGVGLI